MTTDIEAGDRPDGPADPEAVESSGKSYSSAADSRVRVAIGDVGPAQDEGRIDLPLGRKDATRGWWMKHEPGGQLAATTWKVMGRTKLPARAWLALEPLTGRTHQLRVHCAAMGWPIVGDRIYGNAPRSGGIGLTF